MSEKPLLLSSAKSGVLVEKTSGEKIWLFAMAAVGLFVVLVGAADVSSRLSTAVFGRSAALMAFAPAVALI